MQDTTNPTTVADWLACLKLPEYLAAIPLGKIVPLGQATIWTDGNGKNMSRDEYMKVHNGADPEIIWKAKKEYNKTHGPGVHFGEDA
jgi:hypothetical protein